MKGFHLSVAQKNSEGGWLEENIDRGNVKELKKKPITMDSDLFLKVKQLTRNAE